MNGSVSFLTAFTRKQNTKKKAELYIDDPVIDQYQPTLIDRLKEDHEALQQIWGLIGKSIEIADEKLFKSSIRSFRDTFIAHLQLEDGVLYLHMDTHYRRHIKFLKDNPNYKSVNDSEDLRSIMMDMKNEMRGIKKEVVKALITWIDDEKPLRRLSEVRNLFIALSGALVARIQHEETRLYPSYDTIPAIVEEING